MPEVFYTSDLHVGHKLVSAIRGFHDGEAGTSPEDPRAVIADPVRHDHVLAARWDATVKKDDIVYVLGDVSINGSQYALDWVAERPGRKHLIAGNHDPVHPMHSKYLNALPKWLMVFDSVQPFLRRKIAGHEVLLSHFPYFTWGDGPGRPDARYEQYRLPDLGVPLLHGHTHGPEIEHDHSYHVGLDAHDMRLVPQSTILEWLESR
jgi:calcineurin-like phosphoesterase family protein